ncbi:MAG TPA: helix-turn-helix domain-containing protein [Acidimicrobiales bacterium]|nr:helix-turn-helix domain-containing protein [Acidimicrobiales bacterium]
MSDAALRRLEESYPPIVSTAMVAEILGLNARTVLLMAQDGRLIASRIPGSRSYRFFLADVVRMLDENRLAPGSVEPEEIVGSEPNRRR